MSVNKDGCGKIDNSFIKFDTPIERMEYLSKLCWSKWIINKEYKPFEIIMDGKE